MSKSTTRWSVVAVRAELRVKRQHVVIRVDGPHVPRHLGPGGRVARFAGNHPHRGIGAVAGDQVPPVPLDAGDAAIRIELQSGRPQPPTIAGTMPA